MKKIILFSLIIVSFYLNGSLNAQINIGVPDSLNTLQNTERVHSNMNLNNSAMIQQVGNFNEAIINQSNNNGFIPNIAEINQIGNNNFALSGQNGNSNFSYIGQYGSDNSVDIDIDGNYNIAGVLQVGDGNSVEQNLSGNGLHYLVFQYGSDNFIREIQTEQSAIPMEIHQNGNGIKLTIINGSLH